MTTEIVIALIASGIALLGTIISLVVSFITQNSVTDRQFHQSKIMKNYELFIDKKHAAYISLWTHLIKAIGAVKNQRGLKHRVPLKEMNFEDFRSELADLPLTSKDHEKWLDTFRSHLQGDSNTKKRIDAEWANLLSNVDVFAAIPAIDKASYEHILTQIYLSKEVSNNVTRVLTILRNVALIREIPSSTPKDQNDDRKTVDDYMGEIEMGRSKILSDIQSELVGKQFLI